jgi:osmotically-inducible protein OsmY
MAAATMTRPDEQVEQDVIDELRWDAPLRPNQIGVAVTDGVVTLTGPVDTFAKKMAAERAVQRVRGVRVVANDIEVQVPGSAVRTDDQIALAVTGALACDTSVPTQNIEVIVSRGWVTLQGQVPWQYQKNAAEQMIRGLAGVRGVTNTITVRPHTVPSPDEMKDLIRHALVRSAETDAERIIVDMQGAKVVLHGAVRTWAEKTEAERVAWSAPGVSSVENHVVVSF